MNFFFKNIYDPKVLGWLGLAPFIRILALFLALFRSNNVSMQNIKTSNNEKVNKQ